MLRLNFSVNDSICLMNSFFTASSVSSVYFLQSLTIVAYGSVSLMTLSMYFRVCSKFWNISDFSNSTFVPTDKAPCVGVMLTCFIGGYAVGNAGFVSTYGWVYSCLTSLIAGFFSIYCCSTTD